MSNEEVNKGGPPALNRNAMRHGLRAGQLPRGSSYIKRDCDIIRRELEGALIERHGKDGVTIFHAALVQTAIRWERHAMLSQRWLRLEAADMNADQRLHYSREVARASSERDRCLKSLGLDSKGPDIYDALYGPDPPGDGPA